MIGIAIAAALLVSGPLSKFESREPDAKLTSKKAIGDVERCLIDLAGVPAPNVYRQPDRPDEVTILWIATGTLNGAAIGRASLRRAGTGTEITLWLKDKAAQRCA